MMYTYKPIEVIQLDKLYEQAARDAVKLFSYGDVIPKSWLMDKFNLKMPEVGTKAIFDSVAFEFLQNVDRFKDILLFEHKMLLVAVRGEGYRIVKPEQQSEVAMRRLRDQVARELRKAVDTLTHIRDDLLCDSEIRKRDEALGKTAALAAFSTKRLT